MKTLRNCVTSTFFIFFAVSSINSLNVFISEKDLVSLRSDLTSRLDRCTLWRREIGEAEAQTLEHFLMISKFDEFRSAAVHLASKDFPESIDCIDKCSSDIDKYNEYIKIGLSGNTEKKKLNDLLDTDQIEQLHLLLEKTKRADLVEKGLHQHFHGISEKRRQELLAEFFAAKPLSRVARSVDGVEDDDSDDDDDEVVVAREPEPMNPGWLNWQTTRQRAALQRVTETSKWQRMKLIGEQFYHLRKSVRSRYEKNFFDYCNSNIQKLVGNDSFAEIEKMFTVSDQVEQISNKYQKIIGNLEDEQDRLTAEHYGHFCQKIYRLIPFEQIDFMSWLSARQKIKMSDMIQDSGINDEQVYDKLYEFFNQTRGDAKENADDIITKGCRRFIAHHFGDHISEEIEEMRVTGNVSTQYIAVLLSIKNLELELEESAHKKRVDQSISICKRIYLDYNGHCDCNGHSKTCNSITHQCEMCEDNTSGYVCEKCVPNFERDNVTDLCTVPISNNCSCNSHSSLCDREGICQDCDHNTTGPNCEVCSSGYFGDATKGLPDSCSKCPCPNNGECSIDTSGLIECSDCPQGFVGTDCDVQNSFYSPNTQNSTTVEKTDSPANNLL